MNDIATLAGLVRDGYGAKVVSVARLPGDGGRQVYLVGRAHGPPWVLRTHPVEECRQSPFATAAVLEFLEEQGYPAERLVRATTGDAVIEHGGVQLLMTAFVQGAPVDTSAAALRTLGAATGRLHALPAPTATAPAVIPPAAMLPRPELAYAMSELRSVAALVPAHLRKRYAALVRAVERIDALEDLPLVLVHNDCHPANARIVPSGEAVLFDWEGAGRGPAVLDVGFLLASADGGAPWAPGAPPDEGRVAAVIEGYCRHHALTPGELNRLADAVRFRSIVFGAASFAAAIRETGDGGPAQWWQVRYEAAGDIARWARRHFARCGGIRYA